MWQRPIQGLEVELRAGQVLYVPPFWLLHTEATTLSLTLDVRSPSKEQMLLMPALYARPPFPPPAAGTREQGTKAATLSGKERVLAAQVRHVHRSLAQLYGSLI